MSLDFRSLDALAIKNEIKNLLKPSKKKVDPIFGVQTTVTLPFTVGVKKHGKLIEKTIVKLARSSTHWHGSKTFKVTSGSDNLEFDNLVYNNDLKVLIVLESKRDINQLSAPYTKSIKIYRNYLSAVDLTKNPEFQPFIGYKLYFAIFNAYGAHKPEFHNVPVIEPEHLNSIFSESVSLGWRAFEKEKYDFFKENGTVTDQSFENRVKDYENFDQLEERFSKNIFDSYNSNDPEIHQQAIHDILGNPLLTL